MPRFKIDLNKGIKHALAEMEFSNVCIYAIEDTNKHKLVLFLQRMGDPVQYATSEIMPLSLWRDKFSMDILDDWHRIVNLIKIEKIYFSAIMIEDDKVIRFSQPPSLTYQRNIMYMARRFNDSKKIAQINAVGVVRGLYTGLILYSKNANIKIATKFLERRFDKVLFNNGDIKINLFKLPDLMYFF